MSSPDPEKPVSFLVNDDQEGQRLDAFLTEQHPNFSRTLIRKAIDAGGAQVDGQIEKPSLRLKAGQTVNFYVPDLPARGPIAEDIPLEILYEDESIVAVNKPPGMVVHPAKGHWTGTLTSALAFRFQGLSDVGGATRPGIVHRLDRDTSGVILVARTNEAHLALAAQFESRTVDKQYTALTRNSADRDQDVIDQPIGAHPYHREKMAIRGGHSTSRPARTQYKVIERFAGFSKIAALPQTGRTHQIRVHLAHIGCPIVCDRLYGGHSRLTVGELSGSDDMTVILNRQALHASQIAVDHPQSGLRLTIEAPLPADLIHLEQALRQYRPGRNERPRDRRKTS